MKKTCEIKYKSVFALALIVFAVFIVASPQEVHAQITIEPLHKVLVTNPNINTIWKNVRDLANSVVIAALIYVAFLNILRLQVNNYAIKKFLPSLILSIILANFSFFICRVFIDWANVALDLLMNGASGASGASAQVGSGIGVGGAFDFTKDTFKIDPNNLNRSFIFILAEFVGGVMILILAFLFFIRNYVIYFLVSIGPLAFMSLSLTQTKKLFDQWWSQFLKWTYLPVVSVFWLWLGGKWYMSGFTGGTSPAVAKDSGDINSGFLALAFAGVCYYLAITTPFKMGGAIMGKWGDLGKKTWGKTGGAVWNSTGGAGINAGKKWVNDKYTTVKRNVIDYSKDNLPIVKQFNRSAQRGIMKQSLREAVWEKRDFLRQRQALSEIMVDGSYKKNPEMTSRVKAMQAKYFVGDEYDREKHGGWTNKQLLDASTFIKDEEGKLRFATNEEILRGGLITKNEQGEEVFQRKQLLRADGEKEREIKSWKERLDFIAENAAANKELQLRRKGSRNVVDEDDPEGETPSQILARLQGNRDTRTMMAIGTVGSDGRVEAEELAKAATPTPPPSPAPASGGLATPPPPAKPTPETIEASQQASDRLFVAQHNNIAEGLSKHDIGTLQINAQQVHAHTGALNIPQLNLEQLAKDITDSNMGVAQDIRGRVEEKESEAHVSSDIMGQLAETPKPEDRVNELMQIAKEGREELGQNNAEGLGNAVAAAQLINPGATVLLKDMQERGETERLAEHVTRILTTAETHLDDLSKKDGEVLAEQINSFKQKGASKWQAEIAKDAPQEAHREIIIQQSAERLAGIENTDNEQLAGALNNVYDAIIASHQELSGALGQLSGEERAKALGDVHNGLADVLDKSIRAAFPNMNESDRLSGSIQKEAMVRAMTDTQVTKGLAREFGKSMNRSLEITNQMIGESAKSAKTMDITPPPNN